MAKHKILPLCKTTPVVWGSFLDKNPDAHPGRRMQLAYLGFSGRLRQGENKTDTGVLLAKENDTDGVYILYDLGEEEIGYIPFFAARGLSLDLVNLRYTSSIRNEFGDIFLLC